MSAALALSPVPAGPLLEDAWQQAGCLPCQIQAEIAARGFTVGDLLRVEIGAIVDTGVAVESDVSVRINGARVGNATLEAAGSRLALRLGELG